MSAINTTFLKNQAPERAHERFLSTFIAFTSITFIALLGGCKENPIDTSPNVLAGANSAGVTAGGATGSSGGEAGVSTGGSGTTAGTGGEAGGGPVSCEQCPEVGAWYRFNTLKVTSLDGNPEHSAIGVLNNLWRTDIGAEQLNVLFEILDVTPELIRVRALNAAGYASSEGGYCLLPYTAIEFEFAREGCDFTNPVASGINIFAGSTNIPKNCSPDLPTPNTIPVRAVTLSGGFSDDCGQIIRGRVPSASIPRSSLEGTCTCLSPSVEACRGLDPSYEDELCGGCNAAYRSLQAQLSIFGELSYGCEADGEPAVCLEGEFEAERLDVAPEVCQGL